MWLGILIECLIAILGLLFLIDLKNTMKGKGTVVRFMLDYRFPSKWKERRELQEERRDVETI